MLAATLASLILWPLYIFLEIPLWVAGFPICYRLSKRQAWVFRRSLYFDRSVYAWRHPWAQLLYGNEEDGVTGPTWWHNAHQDWSIPKLAFVWSAWRNSVNGLRFIPVISPVIVPARVQYRGNADDPARKSAIGRQRIEWSFTWQGIYAGLVVRWQITATHHASVRLGWKFLPRDRFGVAAADYRSIRCPFGVQFHAWRKS